jgi:F-type H+-transporting ATPase subunit delta
MTPARSARVRNVKEQTVASVYAEALYNAASKQGKAELIGDQLRAIVRDLFAQDPLLEKFLGAGSIRRKAKQEAIERAFRGNSDDLLVDFLHVLNRHGRLGLLREVATAYAALHDDRSGRIHVLVRTASPLRPEQQERLLGTLAKQSGKTPVLETRVEPEILGGIIVQVDDWIFDASVKSKLERLKNQLMAS